MDKLGRQVKDLETKLHNYIHDQNERNLKQYKFNRDVSNNIMALGKKVFPEKFEEVEKKTIHTH